METFIKEDAAIGADIHCVLQKKTKDKWETIDILEIDRNYELFGILAGIRDNNICPISYPKGLPPDIKLKDDYYLPISDKIYEDYRYNDIKNDNYPRYYLGEHSYSHLTLEELFKYKRWNKIICLWNNEIGIVADILPLSLKELVWKYRPLKNYRIVYGFDS